MVRKTPAHDAGGGGADADAGGGGGADADADAGGWSVPDSAGSSDGTAQLRPNFKRFRKGGKARQGPPRLRGSIPMRYHNVNEEAMVEGMTSRARRGRHVADSDEDHNDYDDGPIVW